MIKLVLTDIDDTLIPTSLSEIHPQTLEAISACQEAGIHFAPATGRTHRGMARIFAGQSWAYASACCINGQEVHLDGKLICAKYLDRAALEQVLAILAGFEAYLVINIEGQNYVVSDKLPSAEALQDFPELKEAALVRASLPEGDLIKANIHLPRGNAFAKELQERLIGEVGAFDFVFPSKALCLIDILPKGWGKAQAGLLLAETLGLLPDEVVAFGDSENDLDMLSAFPHSVAVANAMPELKQAARHQIGPSAELSVTKALFELAESAKTGELPAFLRGLDD